MIRNTISSYGSVAKFFHWLVFILLATMLVFGFFLEDVPKDFQPVTYNIHKLTGLFILLLMTLRWLWAITNPKPALPADTLPWQRMAERVVHGLLYLTVIAMPIVGWIGSAAAGRAPHIGDFKFELPIAQNESVVDLAFEIHETLAFVIITLVVIHVVAALYHHIIKRDDILRRMMPGRRD